MEYMTLTNEQRIAICCVLTDVVSDMKGAILLEDSRHFHTLKEAVKLTDVDFEQAVSRGVLTSLSILKEIHYKVKMMIGMTVCELYSENVVVPLHHKRAFEILMVSIDWPISFTEICSIN